MVQSQTGVRRYKVCGLSHLSPDDLEEAHPPTHHGIRHAIWQHPLARWDHNAEIMFRHSSMESIIWNSEAVRRSVISPSNYQHLNAGSFSHDSLVLSMGPVSPTKPLNYNHGSPTWQSNSALSRQSDRVIFMEDLSPMRHSKSFPPLLYPCWFCHNLKFVCLLIERALSQMSLNIYSPKSEET